MKILFASDLHGITPLYQALLDLAESNYSEIIILGGDLLPTLREEGKYEEMILKQDHFIERFLLPFFKKCLASQKNRKLFLIAGNWDMAYHSIFLNPLNGLIDLNQKLFPLSDKYELIGYPFVPPTPFRPKDFEKMDDPSAPWPSQKEPSYTRSHKPPYPLLPINPTEYLKKSGTIQRDLQQLPKPKDLKRAIYIMHSPPFGTSLDMIAGGIHVGSRAIKAFIEEQQPLLTLHGHIHEAPEVSGKYFDRIGQTISVNPGQSLGSRSCDPKLYAVTFDTQAPETTLRHTCFL